MPLLLLAGWWLALRSPLRWNGRRFWLVMAVAIATGLQNAYYTFLFLQLAGLAFVIQAGRTVARRRSNAPPANPHPARRFALPLLAASVAMLGWVVANLDSLASRLVPLGALTLSRHYDHLLVYALNPAALFAAPPHHRSAWWSEVGAVLTANADAGNEATHAYLGLLALAGLGCLACVSGARVLRRRLPPGHAWAVGWVLLFSIRGGVNAWLGLAGLTAFRAANRFSLALAAVALLFLAQALTAATRRWPWFPRAACAAAVCLLAAWDQVPPPPGHTSQEAIRLRVQSDRAFALALEGRLPGGAMVFQLPIMAFPEGVPVQQMGSYEHLRLYLFSTRLRYSFGDHKVNAGAAWTASLAPLPVGDLVRHLEDARFCAVQVNRSGYKDRGAAVLDGLRAAGWDELIESPAKDLVVAVRPGTTRERISGS